MHQNYTAKQNEHKFWRANKAHYTETELRDSVREGHRPARVSGVKWPELIITSKWAHVLISCFTGSHIWGTFSHSPSSVNLSLHLTRKSSSHSLLSSCWMERVDGLHLCVSRAACMCYSCLTFTPNASQHVDSSQPARSKLCTGPTPASRSREGFWVRNNYANLTLGIKLTPAVYLRWTPSIDFSGNWSATKEKHQCWSL